MGYEVIVKPTVLRYLRKLDKDLQRLIVDSIDSLSDNPRPDGCKKLAKLIYTEFELLEFIVLYMKSKISN